MNSKLYKISYTSCGCNKNPHAVDYGCNDLIIFASCNAVVICEGYFHDGKDGGKITKTIPCHKGKINCVRWVKTIPQNQFEDEFVTASTDGTAAIWSWNQNENLCVPQVINGHSNIVTVVDGLTFNRRSFSRCSQTLLVATASVDSKVIVWERIGKTGNISKVGEIKWGSGFCLDVKLTVFPQTSVPLLACAADDNKIHLFNVDGISDSTSDYCKLHVLSGHEDWVRSMDFLHYNEYLYLATGSQDTTIRLYKFHVTRDIYELKTSSEGLEQEDKIIRAHYCDYDFFISVSLVTILSGHEGWVYGVSWYLPPSPILLEEEDHIEKKMELLSSSIDKTMIIWALDKYGFWSEKARVGEVGGNMLGFYGGKYIGGKKTIMGHGYQGSFHVWNYNEKLKNWEPKVLISGHTSQVMDLCWSPKGNYILSVGNDQTTRLHAPWVKNNDDNEILWYEIARPQIHGYDMTCLAVLSEYKYVSGAEEKIIRAFTAPNNFIENFKNISNVKIDSSEFKVAVPQGASVPALGLSNKPVFEQMKKEGFLVDDEYPDLYFSPVHLQKPPVEEVLMQNTLWPEVQKLYGHGYEIYSLAARNDGIVLASSCKALNPEHAAIILWNAKTWLQIQKLQVHQLTVTQMSFSPNGKYLLSVSRDRRWSLFGVKEDGKSYELLLTSDATTSLHTRVIWCCSWTYDSSVFATGSRDGRVGLWDVREEYKESPNKMVELLNVKNEMKFQDDSVTSLAFSPCLIKDFHLLAVGLESGSIHLFSFNNGDFVPCAKIGRRDAHNLTVKRLAFRPKLGRAGKDNTDPNDLDVLQLASCGFDHVIKIYDIYTNLL